MLITSLATAFKSAQNKEIAEGQSAYMKHKFKFLGLPKPLRSTLQKNIFKAHHLTTEEELIEVLTALWQQNHREYHYAACDLAYTYRKLWTSELFFVLEKMIRSQQWWDSVDTLASKLLGSLLLTHPPLQKHMDSWIDDNDMWIRRSALIYQLNYKNKTDTVRLFNYCKKTMHEKEFFIRKAIGWALRQHSKHDPEIVRAFINEHKEQLSVLSFREASKYC